MSTEPCAAHRLDDLVAVVTGAAQGLGLAIAAQLARNGAAVTLADLQLDKAAEAAAGLVQQGLKAEAAHLNVTDSAEVTALLGDTARRDEHLDILVNAAGVGQTVVPTVDLPDAEWARVLGVNLTGTFHCCRAAGAIMERQESGCIVNIASINGQNPAALVAAYNVAKAGVIMLTRTLALELAPYHVRVNAVSPGPVYTDFNRTVMAQRCRILNITEEQMIENIRKAVPLGRWGEPDDIAQAAAFLCSPAAAWITGEVLRISGGMEGVSAAPPRQARR
jgi:NAD(P)-dependent dehydrogenase (short-subunit alcohol dehydrogenase family)